MKPMRILFTAAEADPYVKIGGLGDVAGSLPLAIHQAAPDQVDIRVVLPLHQPIREKYEHLKPLGSFVLESGQRREEVLVYQDPAALIPVYFLDGVPVRHTNSVYSLDSALDADKYIFFSLALLKLPEFLGWRPDVLHANDWHTAVSIYALKRIPGYQDRSIKTVLSVHNLPYLGEGCQPTLTEYGIPAYPYRLLPSWAYHLPLPLGLVSADLIIPVSPGYAAEIQTPDFGCGLETMLRSRLSHIHGIINGINQDQWNPATDPYISSPFDQDHLDQKTANKTTLLKDLGLNTDPAIPLLVLVSRMDHQKGVDIALEGLEKAIHLSWQAIILGSGDPVLQNHCAALMHAHPDRVHATVGFKNELSHQMYAAGDIFLMPSRYEPCGISQLISMRYATIPLAHSTGGLKDTIRPVKGKQNNGTGYLYKPNTAEDFVTALKKALSDYRNRTTWSSIQRNAISLDFSWNKSAELYIENYQRLTADCDNSNSEEGL